MRFAALLRGINVGGSNVIPMAKVKAAFEAMGFEDVSTYIASGNVLFTGTGPAADLERRIEKGLSGTFGYDARVLLRSRPQMRAVIGGAPRHWPDAKERCNVVFLKPPLTPAKTIAALRPKPGIDSVHAGKGVVYVGTRKDALAKSGLPRFAGTPEYKLTTIRTFGTCAKLLELLEG